MAEIIHQSLSMFINKILVATDKSTNKISENYVYPKRQSYIIAVTTQLLATCAYNGYCYRFPCESVFTQVIWNTAAVSNKYC